MCLYNVNANTRIPEVSLMKEVDPPPPHVYHQVLLAVNTNQSQSAGARPLNSHSGNVRYTDEDFWEVFIRKN